MVIDKDRMVEIVRDFYNLKIDSKFVSAKEYEDFWRDIGEALNLPPPRPSKEECIEWLGSYLIGAVTEESAQKINATIEYLKEPSLQWVKNIGASPDCKFVLAELLTGKFEVNKPPTFWWHLDMEHNPLFVKKYIILE